MPGKFLLCLAQSNLVKFTMAFMAQTIAIIPPILELLVINHGQESSTHLQVPGRRTRNFIKVGIVYDTHKMKCSRRVDIKWCTFLIWPYLPNRLAANLTLVISSQSRPYKHIISKWHNSLLVTSCIRHFKLPAYNIPYFTRCQQA